MVEKRRYPREPGDCDPEPKPEPSIDEPQPFGPFHFNNKEIFKKIRYNSHYDFGCYFSYRGLVKE